MTVRPPSLPEPALRPTILAVLLALSGCATTGGVPMASDFTLDGIDGRRVSLSQHLGKDVVVLNFWATWCGPCASELPHLQALHEAHALEGLVILAIAMDGPETVANVAPFVRRQRLTFPVLLDEETRAVALYNPHRSAPYTVFIDRTGRVVGTREGFNPGDEREIEATVRALLAPLAPPVAP